MMGATTAGDTQSEATLMKTISDPQAFADRLQALTAKVSEAQTFYEQAKAENEKLVANKQEAEATYAATMELVRQISAKEADLAAREAALASRAGTVAAGEAELATKQAAFNEASAATMQDLANRTAALAQAKQDHDNKVAQDTADARAALAARTATLENEYQAKLAAVQAREVDAANKTSAAEAAQAAADQLKLDYEAKLADLKKIVDA